MTPVLGCCGDALLRITELLALLEQDFRFEPFQQLTSGYRPYPRREHSVILTSHRGPLYNQQERATSSCYDEESPMGAAEVISFEEVRARKQWDALRHQLHDRFDQWLDGLEEQLQSPSRP